MMRALVWALLLASLAGQTRAAERFGATPPLRAVYYLPAGLTPSDEDRQAIQAQLGQVRAFYARFGLEVRVEARLTEFRGRPGDGRDFASLKSRLKEVGLYAAGRTVVFTPFDSGLGAAGDMAMTGIDDARTERASCDARVARRAWWCGRPVSQRYGGCIHEVGHLLGLSHPARGKDALTVMGDHWRFGRDPKLGLLPEDVRVLKARFGAGAGR